MIHPLDILADRVEKLEIQIAELLEPVYQEDEEYDV